MSVSFANSLKIQRTGLLIGAGDSKKGTLSAWIKPTTISGTTTETIFRLDETGSGALFAFTHNGADGKLRVVGSAAGGALVLDLLSTSAYTAASGWLEVVASWDLALANTKQFLYVNRAAAVSVVTRTDTAIGYTLTTTCALGARANDTLYFKGSLEDFAFWPGVYIDLSVADNLEMFVSSDGRDNDYPNPGPVTGVKPVGYSRFISLNGAPAVHFNEYVRLNRGDGGQGWVASGTFVKVAAVDAVKTSAQYVYPAVYRQSAIAGQGSPGMRWFDSARGGFSYPKSEAVREPDNGAFVGRDEMDAPSRNWPEHQTYWRSLLRPTPEEDREFPPPWLP